MKVLTGIYPLSRRKTKMGFDEGKICMLKSDNVKKGVILVIATPDH